MSSRKQVTKRHAAYRRRDAFEGRYARGIALVDQLRKRADAAGDNGEWSNEKIRISRSLQDPSQMRKIARTLEGLHREGSIMRISPMFMRLTVHDTADSHYPSRHRHSEETAKRLLTSLTPTLFEEVTAETKCLGLFGATEHPFIGVRFASPALDFEMKSVFDTLFPALKTPALVAHLSVARAFSRDRALSVMKSLEGFLPQEIYFNPAVMEFRPENRQ